MRTIIHIGQHKTGTTSIQHYLSSKRSELAKRGLYVPDSLCGYPQQSHYLLNVYALNDHRNSSMKEAILAPSSSQTLAELRRHVVDGVAMHYQSAEKEGCRDVIWSNEGLYLLNSDEEHERLRDLFACFSREISCVCCFRDVDSYKDSYVRQLTKQGLSFSDDPDSYRYIENDSWLFDYERKRYLIERTFPSRIFFAYTATDIVSVFMDRIGYPIANEEVVRLNVTARD